MSEIRIIAVSDIHGKEESLPMVLEIIKEKKADLLVVCGDITQFGKPKGWAKKFLDSIPVKAVAVPGNCDPPEEVIGDMEKSRGTNLHAKKVVIENTVFVGFGGGPLSPHELPFEIPEETVYSTLDGLMEYYAVLVTHAPPRGHLDKPTPDVSLGSDAIAQIVAKYKPRAVFSGHVHEARGIEREGDTVFVNPGPAKDGFAAFAVIKENGEIEAELL